MVADSRRDSTRERMQDSASNSSWEWRGKFAAKRKLKMTPLAARAPRFSFRLSYLRKQRQQNPNPNRLTMTNARILIVEDEAITVSALKRELTSLGYQVAAAASTADEALNAVELHKPDLVLMDITLAGTVNGIVAAVAIRGNFHVPVVFLTAHADDGTLERAAVAGAFGYVLKPFSGPALKAAIETALHKYQTEIESRRASARAA
jgi:CheY-like chemotaxis protein